MVNMLVSDITRKHVQTLFDLLSYFSDGKSMNKNWSGDDEIIFQKSIGFRLRAKRIKYLILERYSNEYNISSLDVTFIL